MGLAKELCWGVRSDDRFRISTYNAVHGCNSFALLGRLAENLSITSILGE